MYHIEIRIKEGKFVAAQARDTPTSPLRLIKEGDLAVLSAKLKTVAIATLADVDAAKKELADYKALVLEEATKLQKATLDPKQDTDAAALAATNRVLATENERRLADLKAKQDALAAEIAKLTPCPA